MKKLISLYICAVCMVVAMGCSSLVKNTNTSEGIIITTVDAGMKGWAIYVNSGNATQAQVDQVKSAYNTYYNAQLICESALEKYISNGSTNSADITTANTSVLSAQSSLLSILNQYLK